MAISNKLMPQRYLISLVSISLRTLAGNTCGVKTLFAHVAVSSRYSINSFLSIPQMEWASARAGPPWQGVCRHRCDARVFWLEKHTAHPIDLPPGSPCLQPPGACSERNA